MHGFLAEYVSSTTKISIINADGKITASQEVLIPKDSYVQILTKEMIEFSHEQKLYHNDIFAIGVAVDPVDTLGFQSYEQFKKELESSFGFSAVVDPDMDNVKKQLLSLA
ncbi:hypothetical protein SAMN04488072_10428 [Lentibacillus halodurans]|uniref:Uncharacterized protein n=1 Tax=Lentibacillus halodurans TaxID=237679 RepID=A0A1I0WYW3_9BACI|nr:hypothetical protein [Lentibacillus halodurans]SFA93919.1 hypothetical protein SAMN04488072_10428 [Lentibacillus halodurans]